MATRAGQSSPPGGVRVHLGLGSNLGDRASALAQARALLDRPDLRIVAVSKVYETTPWGVFDQPRFLNQVIEARTSLSPREVLERCRGVEARLGRERSARWGPRTIDVDILLYGTLQASEPDLTIPHPRLAQRAFALVPLAELDAGLRVPGAGTVRALLDALPDRADVREYREDPEPPAGADPQPAVGTP
jgi:2-amino-4-hydroxy-6-hydroxymethyldihydropteridine diphosphokinase